MQYHSILIYHVEMCKLGIKKPLSILHFLYKTMQLLILPSVFTLKVSSGPK